MAKKVARQITRDLLAITVKTFIEDYVYRIDLDADYQREKIWSRKNQEDLLDSVIKNIDIPKMYLARIEDDESFDFECIDGKQRMSTLLSFYKPEVNDEKPLAVPLAGEKYTYKRLKRENPNLANKIDNFELAFVVYPEIDDEDFLREIFRRLQLGVRLNSGELLKTYTGTMRDFVYEEMGRDAPFLRYTKLSEKRFSRQFTLAQICINSFRRSEDQDFGRSRYDDLGEFFKEKYDLKKDDENLERIRTVLKLMDKRFKEDAAAISSRAVAVSCYLFVETLYLNNQEDQISDFALFYKKLLDDLKSDLKLLSKYKKPCNTTILEEFQKHISQASVEPYAIKSRNRFLEKAFRHYLDPKTKGQIIGSSN